MNGLIYTFYSYKGGVGRSMALANVAEYFYLKGLRVVMVDWDLEAPGLESFFYEDARKAINMFNQVRVPVLGVVENMSYLIAPGSGERIDVFGMGGGQKMAQTMGVPFLGELALDPAVRMAGDRGAPIALKGKADEQGKGFHALADELQVRVTKSGMPKSPTMTMED